MKIYQTILEAKHSKITIFPGIYYFKNKINNKYYIGQALNIRKRFNSHYIQILKQNSKYPIYKAILKYGIENFEYGIIGVFKTFENKELLKRKLDFLEKKYIKEYHSFGESGYNQTKGGDGGILGYKMTSIQKEHIRQNALKVVNDGRYTIYIYNIFSKEINSFLSFQDASIKLKINRDSLYSAYRRKGLCINTYLIETTKLKLQNLINSYPIERRFSKHGILKLSIQDYIKAKEENPTLTKVELAQLLGVCKKTIYNYEKRINEI